MDNEETNRITIEKNGLIYIPNFIKQKSDMEFGSTVTHENYNEKLNLNTSQGDYNTEVLRLLFTEADPRKTFHIRYLDEVMETELNNLQDQIDTFQDQIDTNTENIAINAEAIANNYQEFLDYKDEQADIIQNIIDGVTQVGYAVRADELTGVHEAGNHYYYGTDYDGVVGFHQLPDALYAEEISGSAPEIQGIYFTPRTNSVDESMLTQAVRDKLNRESITDYRDLSNLPLINNVQLVGNKTLSDLGIQPAGNYLTSVPNTYYTNTQNESIYLKQANAASTYATISTVNGISSDLNTFKNTVASTYARVGINGTPSNPRNGDLAVYI